MATMNETKTRTCTLEKIVPERFYSSSALRVARHFWRTGAMVRVLDLADDLQKRPEVEVIGVVDEDGRIVGVVLRERLFALIGKPFGREVLQRSLVREVTEAAWTFHAHMDIFALAQKIRIRETSGESDDAYFALVDGEEKLQGILSAQDLSEHLSRITQDDIELAGRLQERLLASAEFPTKRGYRLEAWSRAAKGVGGDFYYARELAGGKIFGTLCDVSGKGVAASLIVSLVWGILRAYDFRHGLRDLLVSLNKAIVETFHMEKYLTGFFMIFDPENKRVICADMGHSHVMLLRGGRILAVRSGKQNLPIGIEQEIEVTIQAIRLRGGDSLFAYSDGIIEQENAGGLEFGERGLIGALLSKGQSSLGGSLQRTLPAAIDAFRSGTPQQDDMSFLLLAIDSIEESEQGQA